LPTRERPSEPIAGLAPALAVEVLSEGNTKKEMECKVREYFISGVLLVWLVDPVPRTIQVFTAPDQCQVLTEEQILNGGDVLPGLALPVRQVFAKMPRLTRSTRKRNSGRRPPKKPGK
jgi:Uma2 family endonuclease